MELNAGPFVCWCTVLTITPLAIILVARIEGKANTNQISLHRSFGKTSPRAHATPGS